MALELGQPQVCARAKFSAKRKAVPARLGSRLRVLMPVSNPCTDDARVIRQAEALAEAGHEVLVLATLRPGIPETETKNGVRYQRIGVRAGQHGSLLAKLQNDPAARLPMQQDRWLRSHTDEGPWRSRAARHRDLIEDTNQNVRQAVCVGDKGAGLTRDKDGHGYQKPGLLGRAARKGVRLTRNAAAGLLPRQTTAGRLARKGVRLTRGSAKYLIRQVIAVCGAPGKGVGIAQKVARTARDFTKRLIKIFANRLKRTSMALVRDALLLLGNAKVYLVRVLATSAGLQLTRHAKNYTSPGTAFDPDVVHAHDLYTLLAGSRIAGKSGAHLIYDSHELEIGRNGNYGIYEKMFRANAERLLIGRTDHVITVCDSIADFLADRYKIARPLVVHNVPDTVKTTACSDDIRRRLRLSSTTPLAIYVGGVTINRGVENCIRALDHIDGIHLATIGKRYAPVEAEILRIADELGVRDRVHLIDPVHPHEVVSFIHTADVSLIPIQNVCLSYQFCFPNKLLESLMAGLPVVVARLHELTCMVELTKAGLVVDETDPKSIADGICAVLSDRNCFVPTPQTRALLDRTYSWQRQKEKLRLLYEQLAA